MRKMIVTLLCCCCITIPLGLAGCAGQNGSASSITTAQAKAGADYLVSSVSALQTALDEAKATGDLDKIATAESVLAKAKAAADAFEASIPDASNDQWNVARSLISTAVSVLGPIALQALVAAK